MAKYLRRTWKEAVWRRRGGYEKKMREGEEERRMEKVEEERRRRGEEEMRKGGEVEGRREGGPGIRGSRRLRPGGWKVT